MDSPAPRASCVALAELEAISLKVGLLHRIIATAFCSRQHNPTIIKGESTEL